MFDIGFLELLVVTTVGLLVIGPERLPETVRTVFSWWRRFKRSVYDAHAELERQIGADEIRSDLHNEEVLRSLKSLKMTRAELEKAVYEAEEELLEDLNVEKSKPAQISARDEDHSTPKAKSQSS